MTALITLTTAGTDSGPFNLYSNLDAYATAFETAVPKVDLVAGYASSLVPDFTTTVRVLSTGTCTNYIDIILAPLPTTTSTSSSTSTSTSTSTSSSSSTSTTTSTSSTSTTSTSTSTTTTTTTAVACPDCINIEEGVTIGTQTWTNCNLDVTTYSDGTPIPQVTDTAAWAALTTGAWCYNNNNPANGPIYGKLYNWYAVNDTLHGGLAPTGYHIPTDTELTTLVESFGGVTNIVGVTTIAGGVMKTTGTIQTNDGCWETPNTNATNSSGFGAQPGGHRLGSGSFNNLGSFGVWWSSTERNTTNAWYSFLAYSDDDAHRDNGNKKTGYSVRLIKDTTPTTTTTTTPIP